MRSVCRQALRRERSAGIFGSPYRTFDGEGLVAIVGMALTLVISTICNTVKLHRAETLR